MPSPPPEETSALVRREEPAAVRHTTPAPTAGARGCGRTVLWILTLYVGSVTGSSLLVWATLFAPLVLALRGAAGRAWLRRALGRADDRPLQIAGRAWAEPVIQREAAGALSLRALERGDLDGMVRHARRAASFAIEVVPGLGTVMPAIVAWLLPDRMPERSVWPSRVYSRDAARENALLPALRLLEATASPDDAAVVGAWQAVTSSQILRSAPRLFLLLRAIASERIPAVDARLEAQLDHDDDARAFLKLFLPRYGRPKPTGYRIDGEVETALAVATSDEHVQALVAQGRVAMRRRAGIARTMRRAVWGTFAGVVGTAMLGLPSAMLGMMSVSLAGALGVRVTTPRLRAVGPALEIPASRAWRREFDTNPAGRPVVRGAREREAFVSCALAEHALAEGDVASAWNRVQWWLAGFDASYTDPTTLRPIAASIARIAALAGRPDAAEPVLRLATDPMTRAGYHYLPRTVNGDGHNAVLLGWAVIAGRREDWDRCAQLMSRARHADARFGGVSTRFQRTLFLAMAARARADGHRVKGWRAKPRTPEVEVVRQIWPELFAS